MAGRFYRPIWNVIEWLIHDPRRRLVATACFWGLVLAALVVSADPLVWLGAVLGALVPVSLWLAWNGPHLRPRDHLDYFLALTPAEFEQAVADLIVPLGYTEIRVTGGPSDMGVDVLCRDREGRLVAIQCKRYQPGNDISSSAVQTFMGGMVAHEAQRGIIVTTSSFSAPAQELARRQDIQLIDGAELSRMLAREVSVLDAR